MNWLFTTMKWREKCVLYLSEMASSNPTYMAMEEGDLPTRLKLVDDSVPFDSPLLIAYAAQ